MNIEIVFNNIEKFRKQQKLSKTALSLKIGKSKNYLYNLKNNFGNIPVLVVFDICLVLNVSLLDIFT